MNRRWPLPQGAHGLAGERGIYNNYSNVIAAIMRLVDGTGGDTGQEVFNWAGAVGRGGSASTSQHWDQLSRQTGAKALRQRGGPGRRRKPSVRRLGAGRCGERGKEAGVCPGCLSSSLAPHCGARTPEKHPVRSASHAVSLPHDLPSSAIPDTPSSFAFLAEMFYCL